MPLVVPPLASSIISVKRSKLTFPGWIFDLVGPVELHVIAPSVQPVASRSCRGNHLQWHGALHFRVFLRGGLQNVICAEVHYDKLRAVDETDAVRSGLQGLAANFKGNFVEHISLVFLLDGRGIAGAVNHSRENVEIVSKVHPTAVAELHRSTLSAEENTFGKNFWTDVRCLEDNLLPFGGRTAGHRCLQMPDGERQKQHRQENKVFSEARHGGSFQGACIV